MLFRNSRANIQGFPERHLNVYPMPLPEQYKTAIKVMGMMGGNGGDLQTRALRYLYPEKIFQQFEGDNATGPSSTRASNGCWNCCSLPASRRCW